VFFYLPTNRRKKRRFNVIFTLVIENKEKGDSKY